MSKKQPKFIGPLPDHKIIEAFKIGNTQYFEFDEGVFFLPFRRGLMATAFYKELQQGVDREYLLEHTKQYDEIFKNPKEFNVGKMAILNNHLKERLQFIFDADLIYKLASVVYFDESENPYNYNYDYGQKKIKFWKQHEEATAFFLRQPIKKLIPFLKPDEQNILTYLEVSEKIKKQQLDNLSSYKSKSS